MAKNPPLADSLFNLVAGGRLGHLEIAPTRNFSSTPTSRFFLLEKYRKALQVPT